jgi:chromosome segregation ATPase
MPKSWERNTTEEKVESLHERLVRLDDAVNELALSRERAVLEIADLRQQVEDLKRKQRTP